MNESESKEMCSIPDNQVNWFAYQFLAINVDKIEYFLQMGLEHFKKIMFVTHHYEGEH